MNLLDKVDSPTALRALASDELLPLCLELRQEIIDVCGRVGGHLGASLGAVELIVALHRVFKSPVDRIVFDVGHQAYAHKLLTGRRPRFGSLRQAAGVAPFLEADESEHDAFAAGHACTAVSAALGIAHGKRRLQQPGQVVAVVGDGALTGGLTFEGLNNLGYADLKVTVVLNDNEMSISRNVGAVSHLLRHQARAYFEALGFTYIGPVDGHAMGPLLEALSEARHAVKSVVVHVLTEKGRGFSPATADARTKGHAMGPYQWRDGKLVRARAQRTFSDAFASALEKVMSVDPRVVAITPAMLEGSGLTALATRFPDRVFDVGIAEPHAVTMSAGLARAGARPVCCIYSTFLQRAYDQLVHDVALQKLPVIFAIDRAGLVGADGATHQGSFDIAILRNLPGVSVAAPADEAELYAAIEYALVAQGPVAIRFPRGILPDVPVPSSEPTPWPLGRWLKRESGAELTFVGIGPLIWSAFEAAQNQRWNVLDLRQAAPLDEEALREAASAGAIVTVEEGTVAGGLGSAVLEYLARAHLHPRVTLVGLPADRFIRHGDARVQRQELGLDAHGLAATAGALLKKDLK